MMRSSVSTSEVYSTSGKPQNSLPVLLSTVRFCSPEITVSASPSLRDDGGAHLRAALGERVVVRGRGGDDAVPGVLLHLLPGAGDLRVLVDVVPRQPQRELLDRADAGRRASAYTVFFWVSVAITASLAPVRWVAVKSPISWLVTLTSVILWTGVDAVDVDHPHLGLAVLIGAQNDRHAPSCHIPGFPEHGVRLPGAELRASFGNRDFTPAVLRCAEGTKGRGCMGDTRREALLRELDSASPPPTPRSPPATRARPAAAIRCTPSTSPPTASTPAPPRPGARRAPPRGHARR